MIKSEDVPNAHKLYGSILYMCQQLRGTLSLFLHNLFL